MPKLQTGHAANVLAAVQIVRVEHLFDRFDAFGQEAALTIVLPFAVLAEDAQRGFALVYYVAPLVALVAHGSLGALFTLVARS